MAKYDNGTPFNFLRGSKKLLKDVSNEVNRFIDNFNNDKLYLVDHKDIAEQYLKLGLNNIDEFSSNYAFSHHFGKPYDSPESREAMYLEVREHLNTLRAKGEIE